MIIYIVNEISVRELSGYLLFATVAAANNHQVFILSPNDIWLYFRMNTLKPGAYLIKNINIPSKSTTMYQRFMNQGFDIYCQEQEPPVLCEDINQYLLVMNISNEQMFPFKAVFCFGDEDTLKYKEFFAGREKTFYKTGSPRFDIWTSKFESLHLKDKQKFNQPYILIVSNFTFWMGDEHFSEIMNGLKSMELLGDLEHEEIQARFQEEDATIFIRMVLAVKFIASWYPDLRILVRPHPGDRVQYWSNIFEQYSNVGVISNRDSITPWISGAMAVIQNGCTSALEAVIQSVPVISYGPNRVYGNLGIPNRLGIRAHTLQELRQALSQIIKNEYASYQKQSEEILKPIVKTDCKAASEMLSVIEEKSKFCNHTRLTNFDLNRLRLIFYSKTGIDRFRYNQSVRAYTIDRQEVRSQIEAIAETMKLPIPKTQMIGSSGVLVEK